MKKILLLVITLFSLVGCQNYQNTINKFNYDLYNKDLAKLEDPVFSDINDAYFNMNSYLYCENDYYIYTVQIKYDKIQLNNLKVIFVPLVEGITSLLPNVGYSEKLHLTEEKNTSDGEYPGYNLSYKSDVENLDFYVFVSYRNDTYIDDVYYVNTFTRIGD